jgi:hypothetical protein
MQKTSSIYRRATVLAVAALWSIGLPASARAAAPFQPLNSPATREHRPGKFVWADLFTTDPVAAAKFYTGLFGWTTNLITQNGRSCIHPPRDRR